MTIKTSRWNSAFFLSIFYFANIMSYCGTVLSSSINLANTILGAGLLAIPHALFKVGLAQGIILILLAGFGSRSGLILLSKCATLLQSRNTSFFAVSNLSFGKDTLSGRLSPVIFDLAIAIKCFGVSISYLVIVGELASRILKSFFPSSLVGEDSIFLSPSFCITLGLLSVSPFNFFRTLDSLKYTSGFALLAVAYLFCIVVGFAFIWPTGMPEKGWIKWDDVFWWNSDLSVTLHVMPIFVFAFTCHQNLFSIHNELSVQSKTKKAVDISVFSSLFIYQVVGILGYLTFGSSVSDNIISMYPNGWIVVIGQVFIVFLVLFSYPLQLHPCRASLNNVIDGLRDISNIPTQSQRELRDEDKQQMSTVKFSTLTVTLMILSYIIAISVKNLSTVLKVVGATGSTTICYILPGLLYYKVCCVITEDRKAVVPSTTVEVMEEERLLVTTGYYGDDVNDLLEDDDNDELFYIREEKWVGSLSNRYLQYFSLGMCFFGIFFMIVSLYNIVKDASEN